MIKIKLNLKSNTIYSTKIFPATTTSTNTFTERILRSAQESIYNSNSNNNSNDDDKNKNNNNNNNNMLRCSKIDREMESLKLCTSSSERSKTVNIK